MNNIEKCSKSEISLGHTLLGNWFEERQVAHIDKEQSIKDRQVRGHYGILIQSEAPLESLSASNNESLREKEYMNIIPKRFGKRREMKEKELFDKFSVEVHSQFHPSLPPVEYKTTTMSDFTKDFVPDDRVPVQQHDLTRDQPASYWSENRAVVHGVTSNNSFRKNCSFSTANIKTQPR